MPNPALQSILAATDLSPSCDPVLRAAGAIALRTGAVLHVIHTFDLPPSPYLDAREGEATFPGRIEAARLALQAQVERTVPAEVTVAEQRIEIYAAHRAISGRWWGAPPPRSRGARRAPCCWSPRACGWERSRMAPRQDAV
jgi:hypothetical protein